MGGVDFFESTEANIITSRKIDYYKRLVSAVAAASLSNIYKEHGLQDMPKSLFRQSLQPGLRCMGVLAKEVPGDVGEMEAV